MSISFCRVDSNRMTTEAHAVATVRSTRSLQLPPAACQAEVHANGGYRSMPVPPTASATEAQAGFMMKAPQVAQSAYSTEMQPGGSARTGAGLWSPQVPQPTFSSEPLGGSAARLSTGAKSPQVPQATASTESLRKSQQLLLANPVEKSGETLRTLSPIVRSATEKRYAPRSVNVTRSHSPGVPVVDAKIHHNGQQSGPSTQALSLGDPMSLTQPLEVRVQQLERLIASQAGSLASERGGGSTNASVVGNDELQNVAMPASHTSSMCDVTAPPTREPSANGIGMPLLAVTAVGSGSAGMPSEPVALAVPGASEKTTVAAIPTPEKLPADLWDALVRAGRRLGRNEAELEPLGRTLAANWFDSRHSLSRLSEAAALELKIPLALLAALRAELRGPPRPNPGVSPTSSPPETPRRAQVLTTTDASAPRASRSTFSWDARCCTPPPPPTVGIKEGHTSPGRARTRMESPFGRAHSRGEGPSSRNASPISGPPNRQPRTATETAEGARGKRRSPSPAKVVREKTLSSNQTNATPRRQGNRAGVPSFEAMNAATGGA